MVETILSSPLFVQIILPFLLVFAVVFAVLQKSEILGKGKKQIDAIVALVVGLIVIAFGNATGIIVNLMPFLAVSLIIILVFMILLGMLYREQEFALNNGIKIAIGIIVTIALTVTVLHLTNGWEYIKNLFSEDGGSSLLANIIFIVLIIGAVAAVVSSGKSSKPNSSS